VYGAPEGGNLSRTAVATERLASCDGIVSPYFVSLINKKPPGGGFSNMFDVVFYECKRTEQTASCGLVNQ
jgi:hypothetical protein